MRLPFLMKPKPDPRITLLEKRIVELVEPLVAIPVLQNRIRELEEANRALQVRNTQLVGELIEARKREAGR